MHPLKTLALAFAGLLVSMFSFIPVSAAHADDDVKSALLGAAAGFIAGKLTGGGHDHHAGRVPWHRGYDVPRSHVRNHRDCPPVVVHDRHPANCPPNHGFLPYTAGRRVESPREVERRGNAPRIYRRGEKHPFDDD